MLHWWPEYDFKVGAPAGPFARDGFVFSRSFEHVNVQIDCAAVATADGRAATFTWRKPLNQREIKIKL